MKGWIEQNIHPPGMQKKHRGALFGVIADVFDKVKADTVQAFNAHFPYLADERKLVEHGNALLIPHLIDDTLEEYRERVAAASFFLAKAGERAYIIEQLNAHFGDRYLLIEEFLQIYVKILDLSDADRKWVYGLFEGLLNPNIYFNIAELFYFTEKQITKDRHTMAAEDRFADAVFGTICRDGRVLRDGVTVNDTKTVKQFRDGKILRDGWSGRIAEYEQENPSHIRLPILRLSGILRADYQLDLTHQNDSSDFQTAPLSRNGLARRNKTAVRAGKYAYSLYRNGLVIRDGTYPHDGSVRRGAPMYDAVIPLGSDFYLHDAQELADAQRATVSKDFADITHKNYQRNGSIFRDGGISRRSDYLDIAAYDVGFHNLGDTYKARLLRDGLAVRNRDSLRNGASPYTANDNVSVWNIETNPQEIQTIADIPQTAAVQNAGETTQKNYRRDGAIIRNGGTYRSLDYADIFVFQARGLEGYSDTQRFIVRRDGLVLRNQTYARDKVGHRFANDGFFAGKRKHHFRNGIFTRNGEIAHDAMILLPLG